MTIAGQTLTVTQDPAYYILSTYTTGTGSGYPSYTNSTASCGTNCFPYGTVVTITATPFSGSYFKGWVSPCSGTGTCTVTIDSNTSVTMEFDLNQPDLTYGGLVANSPVSAGSSDSISYIIKNIGNASSGSFYVAYYLSSNCAGYSTNVLLGTASVSSISAGSQGGTSGSYTIPSGTATGYYEVVGVIDYNNQVSESNETNNFTCSQIQVQ